ncbi:DUF2268 domain-containing protein [Virgibacillus sp. W0181]|uniref:DUF2268 domain-containing protein n=1 Tax=Virgibacillus sp. W0181 TaxID=3391581 RepID=UPI003F485961
MGVVRTDQWLAGYYKEPTRICKKLLKYFPEASAAELHEYLGLHGMYQQPISDGARLIEAMRTTDVWRVVQKENQHLQLKWNGPNIPIFILPSDHDNYHLRRDHKGKSGLAFSDKLFLFISETNTRTEIRTLFTHEYNHVCRLAHNNKDEKKYTLLDTVILEGLAENAVRVLFGEKETAAWTTYYTNNQLENMWKELIVPNKHVKKEAYRYEEILYGFGRYPKMAGYCVGYYIVKKYMKKTNRNVDQLLHVPTETLAQLKSNEGKPAD